MITIDGSQGEGGGQILRTTLAYAAALGKPVRIVNIRANRPKGGGLRPQHLAAVRAAATICDGKLTGDDAGSRELAFQPGPLKSGKFTFDIGTAGSGPLVLQMLLPALIVANGESEVTVSGGTHNPMAPCFEYLRDVFGVLAAGTGLQAYFEMDRPGFYPAGGGMVRMHVFGGLREDIAPVSLMTRGDLRKVEGFSAASSSLPGHIIDRQALTAEEMLTDADVPHRISRQTLDTLSPGTCVFLRAVFTRTVAGFFALGEIGKPAERVAKDAVRPLREFLAAGAAVDPHAADQLLTLAGLCYEQSQFTTNEVTQHLLTNATVIRQLTGRTITIDGELGQHGTITVHDRRDGEPNSLGANNEINR